MSKEVIEVPPTVSAEGKEVLLPAMSEEGIEVTFGFSILCPKKAQRRYMLQWSYVAFVVWLQGT